MNTSKGQGKAQKTRKVFIMKKSVIETMISYLNGNTVDTAELLENLQSELNHLNSKAAANAALYESAIPAVMAVMSATPMTAKDIHAACADTLPKDFSANKVQYLLLHQLADRVRKIDNGKNPNTYAI